MKNIVTKIFMTIIFVVIILYCIKNVGLNVFGNTTTGYITSTTQRLDNQEDSDGEIYRNTVSYYFELDGKRYEGYASYKTSNPIVKASNQQIVELKFNILVAFLI